MSSSPPFGSPGGGRGGIPEITVDIADVDVADVPLEHALPTDIEAPDDTTRRVQEWAEKAAESALLGADEATLQEQELEAAAASSCEQQRGGEPTAIPHVVSTAVSKQETDDGESRADTRGGGGMDSGDESMHGLSKGKNKKLIAASLRKWLRIDSNGDTITIGSSKYKIAQKLGVQPRDLRFLELQTHGFSPPALLARENAIVVSFESIRCIITLDYVLVINPDDERVAGLIEDFKTQLRNPGNQPHKKGYPGVSKLSDVASKLRYGRVVIELPFELKALEICFDKMVSELSSAATDLEREALPALEVLTKRIRQPDLEAVRRAKSKLVRLKTRIESIHQVLEKFLNHDDDMHRLNLTAEELSRQASEQEYQQRLHAAEARAAQQRRLPGGARAARKAAVIAAAMAGKAGKAGAGAAATPATAESSVVSSSSVEDRKLRCGGSSSSKSSSSFNSQDEAEVAEVEMLLEAYDMHLEHALSRLQTLDEYIQDTEDLINTGLDQKRNELITCDILLTSNIVALGLMTTISAIMGMNLVPRDVQVAENAFNFVAIASTSGTYVVYGCFLLWAMKQNLLAF